MNKEKLLDMIQKVRQNSCFRLIVSGIIWFIVINIVQTVFYMLRQ